MACESRSVLFPLDHIVPLTLQSQVYLALLPLGPLSWTSGLLQKIGFHNFHVGSGSVIAPSLWNPQHQLVELGSTALLFCELPQMH